MLQDKYRLTTVKHVLEYYMENQGFQAESWDDLARMTNVFITVMGKKRLQDLQPQHFNAYASGRRRGSFGARPAKSTGTVRRELTHLHTAIKFCARSKLVHPEHVPYIPMPAAPPPRDRWLTKAEIQLLKDNAKPWSRGETFLKIVLAQPYRRRCIETLEWKMINLATGMTNPMKPGEKATKKKKPMLPMTGELRLYLEQLRERYPDDIYVLRTSGTVFEALEAIAKRAGVEGVTPHVMRHTWATHASMDGVPLEEIARVLGDSIVTVEKVYAKYQPGYLKKAIEQGAL